MILIRFNNLQISILIWIMWKRPDTIKTRQTRLVNSYSLMKCFIHYSSWESQCYSYIINTIQSCTDSASHLPRKYLQYFFHYFVVLVVFLQLFFLVPDDGLSLLSQHISWHNMPNVIVKTLQICCQIFKIHINKKCWFDSKNKWFCQDTRNSD